MRKSLFLALAIFCASSAFADSGNDIYNNMKSLKGDWKLSPSKNQEGKATRHKLLAPLVGTDATGISFKTVGRGSTVQESLLPGNKKEMVSMYLCKDPASSTVKATHYFAKQNQPEMKFIAKHYTPKIVFNCDMSTELCQSGRDHIHTIMHEVSDEGSHLKTTYTSWNDGKYLQAQGQE